MSTNKLIIHLGDSSYKVIRYPAGELQVRLTEETLECIKDFPDVEVIARVTSPEQVIELGLLMSVFDDPEISGKIYRKTLTLPYLPYSRADRRFVTGDCLGLEFFLKVIKTRSWYMRTLDMHNPDYMEGQLLVALKNCPADDLIRRAARNFAFRNQSNAIILLFPDDGAHKRYYIDIPDLAVKRLYCSKVRDPETGKLLRFDVPPAEEFRVLYKDSYKDGFDGTFTYPVLLVDDLCDGGGTFLGIASELDKLGIPDLNLGLYVTHGIFSKGLTLLQEKFSHIYFTDSFKRSYSFPGEFCNEDKFTLYSSLKAMEEYGISREVTA